MRSNTFRIRVTGKNSLPASRICTHTHTPRHIHQHTRRQACATAVHTGQLQCFDFSGESTCPPTAVSRWNSPCSLTRRPFTAMQSNTMYMVAPVPAEHAQAAAAWVSAKERAAAATIHSTAPHSSRTKLCQHLAVEQRVSTDCDDFREARAAGHARHDERSVQQVRSLGTVQRATPM